MCDTLSTDARISFIVSPAPLTRAAPFCTSSSDDYSTDDYSDDEGGWDCSADNYDEGESDSDDGDDWGEDWGERSPGGGDGIEAPSDLPTE